MSIAPSDCVAVESAGASILFFVTNDGTIGQLSSPAPPAKGQGYIEVAGTGPDYQVSDVTVEDKKITVHPDFKTLAAVAYHEGNKDNETRQIRIYFVNRQRILEEICRTDGKPWYRGTLGPGDRQVANSVANGSALTANVNHHTRQLKVFFTKKEDAPRMTCTWVLLGEKNWPTRKISSADIKW